MTFFHFNPGSIPGFEHFEKIPSFFQMIAHEFIFSHPTLTTSCSTHLSGSSITGCLVAMHWGQVAKM